MKKKDMKDLDQIHFLSRSSYRAWLESNHEHSPGIWMIYYKKHTGREGISYREALEEALCYGWIDSLIKKIDENRFARKFIPRKNIRKWSELNMKTVDELFRQGRMTEHGLIKIESYLKTGKVEWKREKSPAKTSQEWMAPEFMLEALSKNEPALAHFLQLPASCKREYILWITQAKKEETIRKRLMEAIPLLKMNQKLGLK